MRSCHHCILVTCMAKRPRGIWVTLRWAFGGWPLRPRMTKIDPNQGWLGKRSFLYRLNREDQKGWTLKPQRHRRERPQREPNKGVWTHQKDVWCWMWVRAIERMIPGQSHPQGGCGVSQDWGPTRISGEPWSKSWHQNVNKCRPKVGRGVIWPRDSLLPGGRGREPRERERETGAGA
jgi:hypothetical protein